MSALNIPDEARDALLDFLPRQWQLDARQGLKAAAPIIVAAELERLANTPPEDGPWWALASSLRDRAAELRGESR